MNNKIAITTGDTLGVGEEITYKALKELNLPYENIVLIGKKLDLPYETVELDSSDNGKYCYDCIAYACKLAHEGKIKGIVTAPVSKEALHKSGYYFNGQTEILEKLLSENENEKAEMLFIDNDLRVMLLTRHLALSEIKITEDIIIEKTKRLNDFLIKKCKIENPKIAICALNPHAGENGILGSEENEIIIPSIKKLVNNGINAHGPFSADALFNKVGRRYLNKEKQEYDGIISMYHDQGLCPVKALCGDKTVNTTIGLKVIRTSPPTGTAYDIKGKNIADPTGMVSAIKLMLELTK